MPIIDADKARTVFAIKRSKNPGFAGIDNELYFSDRTWMLFGDAKNVIGELVKQLAGGSGRPLSSGTDPSGRCTLCAPRYILTDTMPPSRPAPHVHKFGGASLADAAAIGQAVAIVRSHRSEPTIVVVSAMAGTTDQLLAVAAHAVRGEPGRVAELVDGLRARHAQAARATLPAGRARTALLAYITQQFTELAALAQGLGLLRELTARTSDVIVSRGERLSARLFAAALEPRGSPPGMSMPWRWSIPTPASGTPRPTSRAPTGLRQRVLRPLLEAGHHPGRARVHRRHPDGELATLGPRRLGSHRHAAGPRPRCLRVTLWKDVPGLLTADPRVVPDARVIPQLHTREAAELAYYGAKVLHPRALIPVAGRQDRRSTYDPLPILNRRAPRSPSGSPPGAFPVKASRPPPDQALITVTGNGMLGVPGIAARTFAALHGRRISVSLISQASSEHSICFSVPEPFARMRAQACCRSSSEEIGGGEIDGVEVESRHGHHRGGRAWACTARPGSPLACSPPWRPAGSTSWPSPRARPS